MLDMEEVKRKAALKFALFEKQKEYAKLVRDRAGIEEKDKLSEEIAELTKKLYLKPKAKIKP